MGERFLRNALLYSGFLLGLSLTLRAQDCPDNATFEVTHEQTPGGNDGTITVTFTGLHGNMDPAAGSFQYSLWEKEANGYVYDEANIDPGFSKDPRIALDFDAPATITFTQLPPSSGYVVILTGTSCQRQLTPSSEEIPVKAFKE